MLVKQYRGLTIHLKLKNLYSGEENGTYSNCVRTTLYCRKIVNQRKREKIVNQRKRERGYGFLTLMKVEEHHNEKWQTTLVKLENG